VWYSCRRDHDYAAPGFPRFFANRKTSLTGQHKIEFVGALMSMNLLRLTGFKTVEPQHNVFAFPDRGFEKLLRLRSSKIAPIKKMVHALSLFESILNVQTITPPMNDEARLRRP
jgi:hypothetical protein